MGSAECHSGFYLLESVSSAQFTCDNGDGCVRVRAHSFVQKSVHFRITQTSVVGR